MNIIRNKTLEANYPNQGKIYTCYNNQCYIGCIRLYPSKTFLLKSRKYFEIEVNLHSDHKGTQVEFELYKALRLDSEITRFDVIEAVDKSNDASIRFHDRLGFVRTGLETKTKIYYKIN